MFSFRICFAFYATAAIFHESIEIKKFKLSWPLEHQYYSSINGSKKVDYFLPRKTDDPFLITEENEAQLTPLQLAIFTCDMEMMETLIQAGVDVNDKGEALDTPLISATLVKKSIAPLKRLLEAKANVNLRGRENVTALLNTATLNGVDAAKLLLQAGADVNLKCIYGVTPLLSAVDGNHTEMVKLLLEANADMEVKALEKGESALFVACMRGYSEIVEMLLEHNADVDNTESHYGLNAVHVVAANGHATILKQLIKYGVDLNRKNAMGDTALIIATRLNNIEIVKLLVNSKCDVSARDSHKNTALMIAVVNEFREIIEILLRGGASLKEFQSNTVLVNRGYKHVEL